MIIPELILNNGGISMALLYWLQSIRNPVLDAIFSVITRLGEETILMVVGMFILWCVSKKWGYRFFLVGMVGNTLNQLLKAIFLIPRPWVLDPEFPIVESARAAATGYSFPSGHTQTAAGVFGTVAVWARKNWVTVLCIIMSLLVGFSRMYLGVHTPLDVGVSLVTAPIIVVGLTWLMNRFENNNKAMFGLLLGALAFALVLVLYVNFAPVREANNPEFDAHGRKSAWVCFGTMAGLLVGWLMDERHLHYETKAVWWAQLLKVAIGAALVMGVRIGMKPVLNAIFGEAQFTNGIRYFLMAIMASVIWPTTFGFWSKLGQKRETTTAVK